MNNHYLLFGRLKNRTFELVILLLLLIYSCANKGYPEGGAKDETPPVVLRELPASYNKNFDKKYINIYFDEYVQLKNITEKFTISPPQTKNPKIRLREKYIRVDFQDSLRKNVTYNLDFADAIVDNNEGNPLGYYRYVFSTGNVIDSLELSGTVVDAESNEPCYNVKVFIYENHNDSIPLKSIPDYVATTDSSGMFKLTNLRDARYKVIAIKDDSRDFKFTPETELIAFMDTIVRPVIFPVSITDTLENDSIVKKEYFAYGPNNLFLRMFEEQSTELYMTNEERTKRERLTFIFSIPVRNDFKITPLSPDVPEEWYILERSAKYDTLNLWMKDSAVYRTDTLSFALSYLRSDTNKIHTIYYDTVKLAFKEKEALSENRRKNKDAPEVKQDFLSVTSNVAGGLDLNRDVVLIFDQPIDTAGLKYIRLEEKVDTVYQKMDFSHEQDSLNIRKFWVKSLWKPKTEYRLSIDSAAINSIYGRYNNKFNVDFQTKSEEDYGKIILKIKNLQEQVIIQLYREGGKKSESGRKIVDVLAEKVTDKDGTVVLEHVQPGKYGLRMVVDNNRNGKWDTGTYLKRIHPEEIYYILKEADVKRNFDIEHEFDFMERNIGK